MMTHHHFDHVLGVSAYEEEGATVIAAAAHERVMRRAANDTEGLDIRILAPVDAAKESLQRASDGLDTISVTGLASLAPNTPIDCVLHKSDGESLEFQANHTLNDDQIEWFKAGSALNLIRQQVNN